MVIIVIIFNLVLLYSYLSPNNFLKIIFTNFPVVKVQLKICMQMCWRTTWRSFCISILILSFSFYYFNPFSFFQQQLNNLLLLIMLETSNDSLALSLDMSMVYVQVFIIVIFKQHRSLPCLSEIASCWQTNTTTARWLHNQISTIHGIQNIVISQVRLFCLFSSFYCLDYRLFKASSM